MKKLVGVIICGLLVIALNNLVNAANWSAENIDTTHGVESIKPTYDHVPGKEEPKN